MEELFTDLNSVGPHVGWQQLKSTDLELQLAGMLAQGQGYPLHRHKAAKNTTNEGSCVWLQIAEANPDHEWAPVEGDNRKDALLAEVDILLTSLRSVMAFSGPGPVAPSSDAIYQMPMPNLGTGFWPDSQSNAFSKILAARIDIAAGRTGTQASLEVARMGQAATRQSAWKSLQLAQAAEFRREIKTPTMGGQEAGGSLRVTNEGRSEEDTNSYSDSKENEELENGSEGWQQNTRTSQGLLENPLGMMQPLLSERLLSEGTLQNITSVDALDRLIECSDSQQPTHKEISGQPLVLLIGSDTIQQMTIKQFMVSNGFAVKAVNNSNDAILYLQRCSGGLPDVILLDIHPEINCFEVSNMMSELYPATFLPIIMLSPRDIKEDMLIALDNFSHDYIFKPVHLGELLARTQTQLAVREATNRYMLNLLHATLLEKILPSRIISRLTAGEKFVADDHPKTSILFSDICGFTTLASMVSTSELVEMLNELFSGFDKILDEYMVYKVETIGDAYMVASGHDGNDDHGQRLLSVACRMVKMVKKIKYTEHISEVMKCPHLQIRVGIHTGPTYAGVVGRKCPRILPCDFWVQERCKRYTLQLKDRYCFFGDTVNIASRMESTSVAMCIQLSEAAFMACDVQSAQVQGMLYNWTRYEGLPVKGKGPMNTYLVTVMPETVMPSMAKRCQETLSEASKELKDMGKNTTVKTPESLLNMLRMNMSEDSIVQWIAGLVRQLNPDQKLMVELNLETLRTISDEDELEDIGVSDLLHLGGVSRSPSCSIQRNPSFSDQRFLSDGSPLAGSSNPYFSNQRTL